GRVPQHGQRRHRGGDPADGLEIRLVAGLRQGATGPQQVHNRLRQGPLGQVEGAHQVPGEGGAEGVPQAVTGDVGDGYAPPVRLHHILGAQQLRVAGGSGAVADRVDGGQGEGDVHIRQGGKASKVAGHQYGTSSRAVAGVFLVLVVSRWTRVRAVM